MSPSSSSQRQCNLPQPVGGSFPVTSGFDEQQCARQGGTVGPVPDAGGNIRGPAPMSTYLLDSSLATPAWTEPQLADGYWTNARTAERLVLHPICVLRRRLPAAEFLRGLHRVNEEFGPSLVAVLQQDDELRDAMVALVLDISSIAASVVDVDDSPDTAVDDAGYVGTDEPAEPVASAPPVPVELLERGRAVVDRVLERTDDDALREALGELLDLGSQLVGTRIEELGSALTRVGYDDAGPAEAD